MSGAPLGPGDHSRVRRQARMASYDEAVINAILDEAPLCHVAGVVNDRPVVLPTLHAREGRRLYLHSSPASALMRSILAKGHVCVSVTLFDGLRLARSGFESSIAYRSVVLFGAATLVSDEDEKRRVLDRFVDSVLPGRAQEVRDASEQEVRRTLVVAVQIDEASAKVSAGPTDDPASDRDLAIWSGVVPARLCFGSPVASNDGAMRAGDVPVPESVRRLLGEQP